MCESGRNSKRKARCAHSTAIKHIVEAALLDPRTGATGTIVAPGAEERVATVQ